MSFSCSYQPNINHSSRMSPSSPCSLTGVVMRKMEKVFYNKNTLLKFSVCIWVCVKTQETSMTQMFKVYWELIHFGGYRCKTYHQIETKVANFFSMAASVCKETEQSVMANQTWVFENNIQKRLHPCQKIQQKYNCPCELFWNWLFSLVLLSRQIVHVSGY